MGSIKLPTASGDQRSIPSDAFGASIPTLFVPSGHFPLIGGIGPLPQGEPLMDAGRPRLPLGEGLGAPAFATPYVIRHPLGKAPYRSLKYPARGETTKFIRPILWEMTFFASEP